MTTFSFSLSPSLLTHQPISQFLKFQTRSFSSSCFVCPPPSSSFCSQMQPLLLSSSLPLFDNIEKGWDVGSHFSHSHATLTMWVVRVCNKIVMAERTDWRASDWGTMAIEEVVATADWANIIGAKDRDKSSMGSDSVSAAGPVVERKGMRGSSVISDSVSSSSINGDLDLSEDEGEDSAEFSASWFSS